MTLDPLHAQIEDLQEEAWRLAMYTELERMRLQLAMLTPLEGEVGWCQQPSSFIVVAQTAWLLCIQCALIPTKPEGGRHVTNKIPHGLLQGGEEGSSQPGSPNKAAGSSGAAGQGEEEGEQLTLDQLDSEIANVDAELRVRAAATLHRFTVPASSIHMWSGYCLSTWLPSMHVTEQSQSSALQKRGEQHNVVQPITIHQHQRPQSQYVARVVAPDKPPPCACPPAPQAAKAELLDMMSHKAALQEDMASILSAATAGEAAEIEAAAAATAAQQVPTSPGKQAAAAAAAAAAAGEDRDHTGKAVDQKSKAVSEDQLRTAVKQLSATTAAAMKA
jgi:hypothetical protein